MKQFFKRATRLFGFRIARTTSSFKNPLAEYDIAKEEYELQNNGFYFYNLDLFIPSTQKNNLVIRGYKYIKNISTIAQGKFYLDNNILTVQVSNLKFAIDQIDELYILNEIFVEGCYNIDTNEKDCILIDIGMNVGICSLYFAQRPEFQSIYSYEPFEETFEIGYQNLLLNPTVMHKIHPFNYGLSSKDSVFEVEYSPEARGRMGIKGVPLDMANALKQKRQLQLKDAAHTLSPIFKDNAGKCFVLKCDCEGGEYEIIDRLYHTDILSKLDYCMIEWHYESPNTLTNQLKKSGFATVTTLFENLNAGMIYAFKK